jgi:O-antigen/teichoic acid export membrane protein
MHLIRTLQAAISRHRAPLRSRDGASLLSNGSWSLLTQVARVASLAIVMIALSRHLGPQRFGSLAFGLAFVRLFAVLAAFGLDRIFVQHLIEAPEQRNSIARGGFLLKLAVAAGAYIVMLASAFAVVRNDRVTFSIIAVAGITLIFQAFDVFDFAFQAQLRFRTVFLARATPVFLFAVIKVTAVFVGVPLLAFASLEAIEGASIAALLFVLFRQTRPHESVVAARESIRARKLLASGFPILIASLSVMIYMRCDVLMLGKLASYKAAGIYSAASQVTEAFTLFPMALVPALFPFLVRWRKGGAAVYRAQLQKLILGAAVAGFCVSVTLTVLGPVLIRLLYGADYAGAGPILVVHAWSGLFIYVAAMQSGYDIVEGLSWLTVVRTGIGATLNVGLNLLLIPHYGGIGSAVATLVSQVFSGVLLNLVHPRTRLIFGMQVRALLLIPLLQLIARRIRGGSEGLTPALLPIQRELGEI